MSLYPTLEDLKVSELVQAQSKVLNEFPNQALSNASYSAPIPTSSSTDAMLYPSLSSFMGYDLTTLPSNSHCSNMAIAPVSSQNITGIMRGEIKPGVRKVVLCKDREGKVGLTVKDINKGIFAAIVHAESPAAMAGIRFGDQILEINGTSVAGFDAYKVKSMLKKCPINNIELVLRDRVFERTIILNKDSLGNVGFGFKKGEIIHLVKDSSAARNGLLNEHQLIEVDGRCVVGMSDKDIQRVIDNAPYSLSLTIMPSLLYSHMVKCIGINDLKKYQNHSTPDF